MPRKPRAAAAPATRYVVWHTGNFRAAPAREILEQIRHASKASGELRSMSTKKYAAALVEDAPYFLPKKLLAYFKIQEHLTEFDRALEYLAAMPTSGVRILARNAPRKGDA